MKKLKLIIMILIAALCNTGINIVKVVYGLIVYNSFASSRCFYYALNKEESKQLAFTNFHTRVMSRLARLNKDAYFFKDDYA